MSAQNATLFSKRVALLDKYLRKTSFWKSLGILGAHYPWQGAQDYPCLAITADGSIQMKFEVTRVPGAELLILKEIPNSSILPLKLCLDITDRISIDDLAQRFKILRKMNSQRTWNRL